MGKPARFTPSLTKKALSIMKKLAKHPCAKIFLEPVDPGDVPGYYDQIIEHVDISMVNQRLSTNDYTQISEWAHDMKLIWQNSEKYFGNASAQAVLGRELYRLFEREYDNFVEFSVARWMRSTTFTAHKLQHLILKMPDSVKGAFASTFSLSTAIPTIPGLDLLGAIFEEAVPPHEPEAEAEAKPESEAKPEKEQEAKKVEKDVKVKPDPAAEPSPSVPQVKTEKKPSPRESAPVVKQEECTGYLDDSYSSDDCFDSCAVRKPIRRPSRRRGMGVSDAEVTNLMCALALLPDADDAREVAGIMIRSQPELRFKLPHPVISTNDLTNKTLETLIEYAHRRFRELHMEYPTDALVA